MGNSVNFESRRLPWPGPDSDSASLSLRLGAGPAQCTQGTRVYAAARAADWRSSSYRPWGDAAMPAADRPDTRAPAAAVQVRSRSDTEVSPWVDLQLMVFFYPRRADNRTFRQPVTQKPKKHFKFQKRLKIVEISHTSGPRSQPQRHALPLPVSN